MFVKMLTACLTVLLAVADLKFSLAQESKATGNETQITNSIGMKMTLVPAGEFMMGSGESAEVAASFFGMEARYFENEYPQHRVRITKPFYLGTYHVTRGQFRQFVEDSGYKTGAEAPPSPHISGIHGMNPRTGVYDFNPSFSWRNAGFEQTDEHPVVHVNWNDAMAFCKWLSKKEGKSYRLPTEAEWEYACRARTTTRYYSGDDPETLAMVANVSDMTLKAKFPRHRAIQASDGYEFTAPVGQFKPNAFGLYDMLGNAGQWCADWYDKDYYGKSPVDDPTGPPDERGIDNRVLRGCCWHSNGYETRAARRGWHRPESRDSEYSGFRVARTQ